MSGQGGDHRHRYHDARVYQQSSYFCGATQVFFALAFAETQVAVEPRAQLIAIEYQTLPAKSEKPRFQGAGQGRLAGGGQSGQQDGDPAMAMTGFVLLTIRGHKNSIR